MKIISPADQLNRIADASPDLKIPKLNLFSNETATNKTLTVFK